MLPSKYPALGRTLLNLIAMCHCCGQAEDEDLGNPESEAADDDAVLPALPPVPELDEAVGPNPQ